MPTAPDTYGVAQALVALARSVRASGQPAYANLLAGEYKDITDMVPCFEAYTTDDDTSRASMTMGASQLEIFDDQVFWLISTVSIDNATAGWVQLWGIRDGLTQVLHQSMNLNLNGVTLQAVEKGAYEPVFRNGVWWLMHRIPVRVRYEYTATEQA